jgi:hypothetical protein
MRDDAAAAVDWSWVRIALEGDPPPGRLRCATLPLDTLKRAVGSSAS